MPFFNISRKASLTGIKGLIIFVVALICLHAQDACCEIAAGPGRKGDLKILLGPAKASRGGSTPFYVHIGIREYVSSRFTMEFAYINEGHPNLIEAGHRDGFSILGWYYIGALKSLKLELGAGPYFSMNTTRRNCCGREKDYNDKKTGVLLSLSSAYPLGDEGITFYTQINKIIMPDSFDTLAFLAGVKVDLEQKDSFQVNDKTHFVCISGGPSFTTRKENKILPGFEIEIGRNLSENFAFSLAGLSEGKYKLSNRKGLAGRLWFVFPGLEKLKPIVGIGPYIAKEENEDDYGCKILGIASIGCGAKINPRLYCKFVFNRVISDYDKDQDMFLFGVGTTL